MYADLIELNKQRWSEGKLRVSLNCQSLSRSALAEFNSGLAVSFNKRKKSAKGGDTITGITVNRETCLREYQGLHAPGLNVNRIITFSTL